VELKQKGKRIRSVQALMQALLKGTNLQKQLATGGEI
jgi:hypothetical protein